MFSEPKTKRKQRNIAHFVTNLPPKKCLPENSRTPSFGAVRLMSTSGVMPNPCSLPFSTSHPEGMSTETIGRPDDPINWRAASNGARMGGLNEKPKIASNITSEFERAFCKGPTSCDGAIVSIFMLSHCFFRRFLVMHGFQLKYPNIGINSRTW